jgi:type VI secretion system secreted protein Hcp
MKSATLTVIAALVFLTCSPAYAAVEIFMQISGIPGESMDPEYPGWIELQDWKISILNTNAVKKRGAGGKPSIGSISITKQVDLTTTIFHKQCCDGKHYPEAILIVRKAGEPGSEYVRIDIQDLVITSVSTGGSGGEDRITENVTLKFSEFKTEYRPDDAPPVSYGWNKDKFKKKDKP